MPKHKHFHNIKNPMQMFQHSRREGIGLLDPGRALPKKKTPAGAANTDEGKKTQHSS